MMADPGSTPSGAVCAGRGRRVGWGLGALVVALSIAAFLPALGHDFVNWDDDQNFLKNPGYRGLGPRQLGWMLTAFHIGHYTPLTWLTLGLDYSLWGMDARGYHSTNVFLHAATALVFYFLGFRLLRLAAQDRVDETSLRIGAATAALVFAVHPLRVESVAWVTERRDVLSGLFFVSAILAYLKAVGGGGQVRRGWYCGTVGLFGAALLSKASTVPLPAVLLLLDVYPLRRLGGASGWLVRRVLVEKLPFLLLAIPAVVVALLALLPLGNTPTLEQLPLAFRAMVAVYGLAFYLIKTVLPLDLSPLYQLPITVTWLHFAIVIAGSVTAVTVRRACPAFTAAWCSYVLILLPVLRIVQGGPQIVADRYSYLSCLGWALLAGGAAARKWAGAGVVRAVAAAWILALAAMTWQQTEIWRSSATLWSHAVSVNPESRAAHANLARAYAAEGRTAPAVAHYEETLRLSLNKAPYHAVIGELYEKSGQKREALGRFAEALRLMPGLPEACRGVKRLADRGGARPKVLASCPPEPLGPAPPGLSE